MEELRIINSGIPVLDSLLGGGFLSNSIIIISHWPGVKILELDYQLLSNNFDENTYLIVVTFHFSLQENISRIRVIGQKLEFFKKIMELISSRLIVIDCFSITNREEEPQKGNTHYVSNPFNVDKLLSVMANIRESIPEDKRVVWFFFNLTIMSIGVPEEELVKFCWKAFRYHKQHGDQAIYTFNEKAHTDTFFAKMYQLSDVFLKLIAEYTPHGLKNGAQVIKSVFPFQSKKIFYEVNGRAELRFTNNKLESKPETLTNKLSHLELEEADWGNSRLITTGVPELNSLLGGGILSNSIIVFSHQCGVRIIEPIIRIFQNQFSEKTHIILINYHYSPQEYETRLEIWKQIVEIHKGPAQSLQYGNMSFIDCFNSSSETDTPRSNIYPVFNPFDIDKLLSVMTNVRNSISEEKSVFWLFHSLTDMSIGVPEEEVLKFCRRAFRYHKWCGDLAAFTVNEQAHSEMFHAKLYQLADVFIKFIGENTCKGIDTSIQILKGIFNWDSKKTKYLLDEKGQVQLVED